LSEVDGKAGKLIIRGKRVEDLAESTPFEAAAALLWQDLAPVVESPDTIRRELARARVAAFTRLIDLVPAAAQLNLIEGLRLGLSALSDNDEIIPHYLVTAAIPVFLAALVRARANKAAIEPDESLGQAADFLRMLQGDRADKVVAAALDAYLVTVCEHG